jgi:autotransporter-associated beta strand protein
MSSDAIRKSLFNWFLLLTTAVVLNSQHSSCAQEQGIQNFQKMKYGFFVHYVWGGTAYSATVNPDGSVPAGLDELADRFDAARFADDLHSMEVEYVLFTAWHANMNCLWPSPKMNHWLPGHASRRDVLRDMITAVRAKGIRVLLYTHPSDGHDLTAAEQLATGWGPTFDYAKWNDFINDIYGDLISRYGNDIEGVYIDEHGGNATYVDYARLRQTVKGGNTNLLMLQNYYGSIYSCDLGDKEVNALSTDGNIWPAPDLPSATFISSAWWASKPSGQFSLRFSPESIFRYTVLNAGISSMSGGPAWAAGNYSGHGWEDGVLQTMQRVASYLRPIARSVTNTYASTSYVTVPGATIQSLSWGVATKSTDDRYEYLHVLKPPTGTTLVLPPPADLKRFGSARLLANKQKVSLWQNKHGVTLTLKGTDAWDRLDTVIELKVIGYLPFSNSMMAWNYSESTNTLRSNQPAVIEQPQVFGAGDFHVHTDSMLVLTEPFPSTNGLILTGGGTLLVATSAAYSGVTSIVGSTIKLSSHAPTDRMAHWFDASNLRLANGTKVSQWNDLSGHDANAMRAAGDNGFPSYVADAETGTGLGAIHFGAMSGAINPALNSQALTFAGDLNIRTVFSIFKGSSFLLTDYGACHFHRRDDTNPAAPLWIRDFASPHLVGGTTYVNGMVVDGTTYSMPTNLHGGFNLVELMTTNTVTASGFNKDRFCHAGDQYQAEVLLYDFPLSETQRLQTEAYLNAKWFGIGMMSNLLPTTTTVNLSNGGTLDLNGLSQTCASLSSTDRSGTQVKLGRGTLTLDGAVDTKFDGVISGAGNLVKRGGNIVTLTGTNNYQGHTLIAGGKLRVNGLLESGTVTVAGTATLEGHGKIKGAVTVQSQGTIATGKSPGTLTISNTLTLGGTTAMKISKTIWRQRHDLITGISTLTYGGVLNVDYSGRALAAADSFKLFSAMHYFGSFDHITPPSPGNGLAWDMSRLTVDGILQVKRALSAEPH